MARAFLILALLLASVIPPCGAASCCAHGSETAVQSEMPCCAEPTVASREAVPVVPSVPVTIAAVTLLETFDLTPPPAQATFVPASAHHEPQAPLFLRNEQLLI